MKRPYVLPIADPVEQPPYYFGTKERPWISCGLHLPSDPKVLHELCAAYLDGPIEPNPKVTFSAIENSMWCTINLYQQAGSIPQPHEGWVEYLELTFMFGVRRTVADQPSELCWFLPVLFLDGTEVTGSRSVIYAITGGREIFGLAKTAGAIEFKYGGPLKLDSAELSVVDLPAGQKNPAPLGLQKVLTVEAVPPEIGPRKARKPRRRRLIAQLLGIRPHEIEVDPNTGRGTIPDYRDEGDLSVDLKQIFGGPLVGLKQLHDASSYPNAAFQVVVESPYEVLETYRQDPYLYADHLLTFFDSENVTLVDSLGLKVDDKNQVRVRARDSFYLKASAKFGDPAITLVWHPK